MLFRSILRRIGRADAKEKQVLEIENLKINLADYTVAIDKKAIALTKKEIEILWTLAGNKNKVFSRDSLLNSLWGYDYFGDNRTVDSHIKRLRSKLEVVVHDTWEIKTIWGIGYKFEVQGDD